MEEKQNAYFTFDKKWTLSNECNAQIRSKLPIFHNPLKRFIKSKNQREVDSEVKNINHRVIEPHVFQESDELANLDSGKYLYSWWIKIALKKEKDISFLSFSLFLHLSLCQRLRWTNKVRRRAIPRFIDPSIIPSRMLQGRVNLARTSQVISPKSTPMNPRPPLRTPSCSPRVPSIAMSNRVRLHGNSVSIYSRDRCRIKHVMFLLEWCIRKLKIAVNFLKSKLFWLGWDLSNRKL